MCQFRCGYRVWWCAMQLHHAASRAYRIAAFQIWHRQSKALKNSTFPHRFHCCQRFENIWWENILSERLWTAVSLWGPGALPRHGGDFVAVLFAGIRPEYFWYSYLQRACTFLKNFTKPLYSSSYFHKTSRLAELSLPFLIHNILAKL